jgi:hypothetical protein
MLMALVCVGMSVIGLQLSEAVSSRRMKGTPDAGPLCVRDAAEVVTVLPAVRESGPSTKRVTKGLSRVDRADRADRACSHTQHRHQRRALWCDIT